MVFNIKCHVLLRNIAQSTTLAANTWIFLCRKMAQFDTISKLWRLLPTFCY